MSRPSERALRGGEAASWGRVTPQQPIAPGRICSNCARRCKIFSRKALFIADRSAPWVRAKLDYLIQVKTKS